MNELVKWPTGCLRNADTRRFDWFVLESHLVRGWNCRAGHPLHGRQWIPNSLRHRG